MKKCVDHTYEIEQHFNERDRLVLQDIINIANPNVNNMYIAYYICWNNKTGRFRTKRKHIYNSQIKCNNIKVVCIKYYIC